jgi:5-methylcytosine-specific restriction endonuclease McrA
MALRACLDCGALSSQSRCPEHRANATGERGSTTASRRRRVRTLEAAGYVCFYCSAEATIEDHFVPLSRGGADDELNTVAACHPCNAHKRDRDPDDFMASDWLRRRRAAVANH